MLYLIPTPPISPLTFSQPQCPTYPFLGALKPTHPHPHSWRSRSCHLSREMRCQGRARIQRCVGWSRILLHHTLASGSQRGHSSVLRYVFLIPQLPLPLKHQCLALGELRLHLLHSLPPAIFTEPCPVRHFMSEATELLRNYKTWRRLPR